MGLDSSQARYLFLTKRGIDCEYKLMKVANEGLALARESVKASKAYSDALDAVNLKWAVSGEDKSKVDLTYGLLMKPNNVTYDDQYIYTNASNGKVILDTGYIKSLGLNNSGSGAEFQSAYPTEECFISQVMGIDETEARNLINETNVASTADYTDEDVQDYLFMESDGYTSFNPASGESGAPMVCSYSPDKDMPDVREFSYNSDPTKASSDLNAFLTDVCGDIKEALEELGVDTSNYGEAYRSTIEFYQAQLSEGKSKWSDSDAIGSVADTNEIYLATSSNDEYFIDVNQLIKTFLTFFDIANGDKNTGDTDEPYADGSTTTIRSNNASDHSEATGAGDRNVNDVYEVNYYLNLYDALCISGWERNDKVNDKEYLQNQITYGNIAIKQYNSEWDPEYDSDEDMWQNFSTNSANSPMTTETDEVTLSKAEAEYDASQDRLTYKEKKNQILKNSLDTELAAIKTEKDSVQKIIDNHMNSFKMFNGNA